MNRRALLGAGVVGVSAAAGVAALVLRDDPRFSRTLGGGTPSKGRANVETAAFLADPRVVEALRRRGLAASATSEPTLALAGGGGGADWLWPCAAPGESAGPARVVFTSPLVIFSWAPVVRRLAEAGLVRDDGDGLRLDTRALLRAATEPAGRRTLPKLTVVPPATSDAGLLFAALAETLTGGRAGWPALFADSEAADGIGGFLAADPDVMPLRVGFENALVRQIAADPGAWAKRQASAGSAQPVTLYPTPTMMAEHVLIPRGDAGAALAEALLTPELQALGRSAHGFRGPQGQPAAAEAFSAALRTPARLTEVLPTPPLGTLAALARALG